MVAHAKAQDYGTTITSSSSLPDGRNVYIIKQYRLIRLLILSAFSCIYTLEHDLDALSTVHRFLGTYSIIYILYYSVYLGTHIIRLLVI